MHGALIDREDKVPRAPKKCGKPGCEERVTARTWCKTHTPVHSKRSSRLPADWADLRAQVKARANGRCEALVHHHLCNGTGAECDHIIAGDDHRLSNLQWLSRQCHQVKSIRENRDRNRYNVRGSR